ncbi:PEGA domain-containing protein [Patescibacteria group bacterium]|nr:PEGA domain-containing protein [Patescibacteria group bacterium]
MKIKPLVTVFLTMFILSLITAGVVFYSEGWRFNTKNKVLQKTGMLAIRSIPEGAKVYLNGKTTTATNDTIPSLTPGMYEIKVEKEGFEVWEKEIEIFPELVTDITAILISQSPRIEPLTNTGVSVFSLSSSLDKLAYVPINTEKKGIWVLPLSGTTLNLFRTNPNLVAADDENHIYSSAENIWWSPDDSEMLIQLNEEGFYLIDLQNQVKTPTEIKDPQTIFEKWEQEKAKKRKAFLEKEEVSAELINIALDKNTIWSPDEKKFLYLKDYGEMTEIEIYNMEDPLPVGEKRQYTTYRTNRNSLKYLAWYPDSYHLALLEDTTISLIRIDGTNKTEIFTANGSLADSKVFPSPWGDKMIILASFKQNTPPDLYAVGIR